MNESIKMLVHLQSMLEHNFLAYDNHNVSTIISCCKADTTTPYALEVVDLIDPDNNHVVFTASTLERLLSYVPLNLACFEFVPYVHDCEACKQIVENFMAKATKEKVS